VHFHYQFLERKKSPRALLATQRKMSHFKGSESDTQKHKKMIPAGMRGEIRRHHFYPKLVGFCIFEQN